MHQLKALCLNFDQQENIYCATQLCNRRDGLVVQICRLLVALVKESVATPVTASAAAKSQ